MSGSLTNLLGLPMGLGPSPTQAQLQGNTAGINPQALGSLYQAINRYVLQGTDPGISHSLLGSAAQLYPSWSPMYQLANMQAAQTSQNDAQALQGAAGTQAPQTPNPYNWQADRGRG